MAQSARRRRSRGLCGSLVRAAEKIARVNQTKPLWTCPRYGNRFVTPNMWHSCNQVALQAHFAGKTARQRELFNAWLAFVQKHGGPVTVIPQKTRISFQARVRFAGALIRRNWIECRLWLKRRVEDPVFIAWKRSPPAIMYIIFGWLINPNSMKK